MVRLHCECRRRTAAPRRQRRKQMTQLPTLFVSHGAPTLAIDDSPARRFLLSYGDVLGKPRAILVLSAHFETPVATVTASSAPETIYDFWGFPEALYDITYPAPGDSALAGRVTELLSVAGIPAGQDDQRGLDHGASVKRYSRCATKAY